MCEEIGSIFFACFGRKLYLERPERETPLKNPEIHLKHCITYAIYLYNDTQNIYIEYICLVIEAIIVDRKVNND